LMHLFAKLSQSASEPRLRDSVTRRWAQVAPFTVRTVLSNQVAGVDLQQVAGYKRCSW
jgi:hypothetical protein